MGFKSHPFYNSEYYLFNTTRSPFNDARVHRDLTLTIDRTYLTRDILNSGEEPLTAMVSPMSNYRSFGYFNENTSLAQSLLTQAGYPGGQRFPVIAASISQNDDKHLKVAEFVRDQWREKLGISLEIKEMNDSEYAHSQRSFNYNLLHRRWIPDYLDPLSWLNFFHSRTPFSTYRSAILDHLVGRSDFIPSPQAQIMILQTAEEQLMKDLPSIPLYNGHRVTLLPATRGKIPSQTLRLSPSIGRSNLAKTRSQ